MNDDIGRLEDLGVRLIGAARRAGADAADAAVVRSRSQGAQVRMGKLEELESSESDDLSLRVFVGGRVATVSADLRADMDRLAERAVAMARVSPEDPYAGLADPALLAPDRPDLDLFDPTEISSEALIDTAREMEDAALGVPGVTKSGSASASYGVTGLVLVTSTGFSGSRQRSGFSRSVSAVAGEGTGMERDYDFDSRIHAADLEDATAIGRRAGERAVRRVNPQKVATGRYPIVLDPRVSRGLIGSLLGAINGAAIARGTSFLKNRMGERVLPPGLDLVDEPRLQRRAGSRPFDGEGVGGERLALVEDGVLRHWILDSATARELKLQTNGRASRSSSGVSPSSTNVTLTPGARSPEALVADTHSGIYVTEMIGSGANLVTGDYSRGASGFLIENGRLAGPVSEFTVAGNLLDMLAAIEPADDRDERFSVVVPTLRIGEMTVAGR
ncbi:TldD/PmbA family protein [Aureimonas phyllosphaerae]|uniref:PmbA protein n=1 Tax=Aureimonas phyllosphaerae TaxID=1166078 RepID=A0A7W6FV27_9HYPH|nr:TldD/PmbA family protein [Aureimonas phyllosphaerae]MBB3936839.1 PmbA protein [Aureimonas phyllosphaerae]MBB3961046.1 PmbA protein [Aureimonas phyllosphaerae]SFF26502.1 microcin-processing peptidase 1. Unknown type peptidase. MEROPS family U62 [Aureimonas phyllosphaerae]